MTCLVVIFCAWYIVHCHIVHAVCITVLFLVNFVNLILFFVFIICYRMYHVWWIKILNVSVLLLDDALKPATPLTSGAINETLRHTLDISQGFSVLAELVREAWGARPPTPCFTGTCTSIIQDVQRIWGWNLFQQQTDVVAARCRAALGMHSGDIPDDAITASSSFDPVSFGPSRARYLLPLYTF